MGDGKQLAFGGPVGRGHIDIYVLGLIDPPVSLAQAPYCPKHLYSEFVRS